MLKLYDHLEILLEEENERERFIETSLNFFAVDIMEILDIADEEEITISLNRAFQVCSKLNIPFNENFKRVYRFNGEVLIADWKISPLACYLIIINCDPGHERVAEAQLYFAANR